MIGIAFLGVFLGVFCRTTLPYLRKWKEAIDKGEIKEGERLKFETRYIVSAAIAFVTSLIVSALIFPAFTWTTETIPYLFLAAFSYGWSANDIINEVVAT